MRSHQRAKSIERIVNPDKSSIMISMGLASGVLVFIYVMYAFCSLMRVGRVPAQGMLVAIMTIWSLGGVSRVCAQDTLPVVKSYTRLQPSQISFLSSLPSDARFGLDITSLGDLDSDGVPDMAVSVKNDVGAATRGAFYVLFMNSNGSIKGNVKIGHLTKPSMGDTLKLDSADAFGTRMASLGQCYPGGNAGAKAGIAVMASGDDDGGTDYGAVYIMFLNSNGTLYSYSKIAFTSANFGSINPTDGISAGLANIGDIDNDNVMDIAVGEPTANSGKGALRLWRLNANGTLKGHSMISSNASWGGTNPLIANDNFGWSCTGIGDLDGDGMEDIAVNARYKDNMGAVYILLMNTNYTVKSYQKIGKNNAGGLQHSYNYFVSFGFSVENAGDVNGDGVTDLVAGLRLYNQPGADYGGAMIVYLNTNGTVQKDEVISNNEGQVSGNLGINSAITFGSSVSNLGDINGDGQLDVAVGAASVTASGQGNVWLLKLSGRGIGSAWTLDHEPSASIVTLPGRTLQFVHLEESEPPAGAKLTYEIDDAQGNVKLSGTTSPLDLLYGSNVYSIALPAAVPFGPIYTLSVTDLDGQVSYLRFQ